MAQTERDMETRYLLDLTFPSSAQICSHS